MKIQTLEDVKNAPEARSFAVEWQTWASKRNMSYGELLRWQNTFYSVAKKYGIVREFKENGII